MTKNKNIFSDVYQNITNILKITKEGVFHMIGMTDKPEAPFMEVGKGKFTDHAKNRHKGTRHYTTDDGWVANPTSHLPSSSFTPGPPVISSLFTGPLPFVDNPAMLLGIIALIDSSESSYNYSSTYNRVDTVVIDNKELDNELFLT